MLEWPWPLSQTHFFKIFFIWGQVRVFSYDLMLQTVKYYLYRILLLFSNTIIWWDWIQRNLWHISDVKRWQQCSGGVSDQDAPYLRIRVCCKTLKITKLEAAAGQAGKHCLTMFGMERTKTTGLHREHVVSIRTLSITAYMSAGGWIRPSMLGGSKLCQLSRILWSELESECLTLRTCLLVADYYGRVCSVAASCVSCHGF